MVIRPLIPAVLLLLAIVITCSNAPAATSGLLQAAPTSTIPAYHRDAFGAGWAIVRGHCDTREIILERDAGTTAVDTDGDGCKDNAPVQDLYTGRLFDPPHTDADHVVARADTWYSGAWQWTPGQRHTFAQDQANLRAVGASINRSKGDLTPDRWKPPARAGWCGYAQIYRATKQRWHLTITPA